MNGNIEWYDGAMSVGEGVSTTSGSPSASSGGPIMSPEGIDMGHSFGTGGKDPNEASDMAGSGKSVIDGPMDM